MKHYFSITLSMLLILSTLTGCDKSNKYNPAKGLDVNNRLQAAKSGGDSLELAKLAVEQNKILKDRSGAMDTMRQALNCCADIQNSRERIETYSQIAASYSELNAIVEARNALSNAMSAYENWEDEIEAANAKKKKAPTQGEIEAFAGEKMEILMNLATAQVEIVPIEAQKTLMLAKEEAKNFSDVLMRVDKLLDLGAVLGKIDSYDNLLLLASDVKAYLNGEEPESTVATKDDESVTSDDEDTEDDEVADSTGKKDVAEPLEIDMQQKGSRLAILGSIFVKMKHKEARATGIEILDEAVEVAQTIDNKGRKAITLCEIVEYYVVAKDMEKAKATLKEAEPFAKQADSATRESADEALTKAKGAVGE